MVDKTHKSKLLGRPKELHEETERLTFHLEKSVAEVIRGYVTKERKISVILRDAATEYLEKLQQIEAIGKLGSDKKELVELYNKARGVKGRTFDLLLLAQIEETNKSLLNIITNKFLIYKETMPHDYFQSSKPLPEDNILAQANMIFRELGEQYSKSIFDVYHILLSFLVWDEDWHKRREQFMDSLKKVINEMESRGIKEIPLPDISAQEGKEKE